MSVESHVSHFETLSSGSIGGGSRYFGLYFQGCVRNVKAVHTEHFPLGSANQRQFCCEETVHTTGVFCVSDGKVRQSPQCTFGRQPL